jgi:hypothetical protein
MPSRVARVFRSQEEDHSFGHPYCDVADSSVFDTKKTMIRKRVTIASQGSEAAGRNSLGALSWRLLQRLKYRRLTRDAGNTAGAAGVIDQEHGHGDVCEVRHEQRIGIIRIVDRCSENQAVRSTLRRTIGACNEGSAGSPTRTHYPNW